MASARLTTRVLIAFACVYFFWGSTYVAIRFGVQVLPPLVLGSARFLIAGPLMLGICALRGIRLRQTPRDFAMLALIGVLMLGIGNVAVVWAEQYLTSGLAALLLAVIPLYVALFEVFLPHGEALRPRGWAGIAIGFAGLIILLGPGLHTPGTSALPHQLLGALVAIAGALAWTLASILSRRSRLGAGPFVAAAWEMLFAGLFNFLIVLFTGGTLRVAWPPQAVWSVAWLVVFGSLVGYTAYIYLLEHVPVAKVSTYAYINPIVAVLLGAIFLGERLHPIEYLGMAAILIAVYLVTTSRLTASAHPPPFIPVKSVPE